MKMICVNNGYSNNRLSLTIGKEYEVARLVKNPDYVIVTNDKGHTQAYHIGRFSKIKNA